MFDDNYYSSSPKFARETVYIKATSDKVFLLDTDYKLIMEHPRLYGKGKESMKWLPYIEILSKRPTAIKYTSFYDDLPDNWKRHLNELSPEEKRKALITLHTILQKHDMGMASDALGITLSSGVKDADSILASYRRLTVQAQHMKPMELPPDIIKLPSFRINNLKYDDLFCKEVS